MDSLTLTGIYSTTKAMAAPHEAKVMFVFVVILVLLLWICIAQIKHHGYRVRKELEREQIRQRVLVDYLPLSAQKLMQSPREREDLPPPYKRVAGPPPYSSLFVLSDLEREAEERDSAV